MAWVPRGRTWENQACTLRSAEGTALRFAEAPACASACMKSTRAFFLRARAPFSASPRSSRALWAASPARSSSIWAPVTGR